MTGLRCNVSSCRNNRLKTKKSNQDISYHAFPKNASIRKVWIERCNRPGEWNPKTCHVCSIHFAPEDYQRDLQAELLNLQPKRKLKPDAVPTLHLNEKISWEHQVKTEPALVQGEGPNEIFLVDLEGIKMEKEPDDCAENLVPNQENEIFIKTEIDDHQDDPLDVRESSSTKVRTLRLADDTAHMYEVLMKRYSALVEQNADIRKRLKFSESVEREQRKLIRQLQNKVKDLAKRDGRKRLGNEKESCFCCSNKK